MPSALAASLTVLFAFATLRRILGEKRAFIAALVLPISMLWLDKAPSAEIDMLQLAWVSAALFAFSRVPLECGGSTPLSFFSSPQETKKESGVEPPHSKLSSSGWWLVALVCVAGGFLTKWTAPAFFYLAVVPFLWQRGRLRLLFQKEHFLALAVALAICGGWMTLAANEVGWEALRDTIYQEAAQRFAPKGRGKPYPWLESLTFPAVVLGATLPWSIPALFALRPAFWRSLPDGERRLVLLLHCWAWPNLLFWSLPSQHNVRYVLPICPAITLLGVMVILRWARQVGPVGWKLASPRTAFVAALMAWATVKIVFVEVIVPERTANRNARETGQHLAALVPEGELLYLCRLKDEGLMFYYGRPVRRLSIAQIPEECRYVILLDEEWKSGSFSSFTHVATVRDQQQAPIHLVRRSTTKDEPEWLAQERPNLPKSTPSPR